MGQLAQLFFETIPTIEKQSSFQKQKKENRGASRVQNQVTVQGEILQTFGPKNAPILSENNSVPGFKSFEGLYAEIINSQRQYLLFPSDKSIKFRCFSMTTSNVVVDLCHCS